MRIVQIGSCPPPYDGVSVHLERLHRALQSHGRESVVVAWDAAQSLLDRAERSIVHFHDFTPRHTAALKRTARRHVALLSLHDAQFADEIARSGTIRSRLIPFHLRRLACVVVNNRSAEACARMLLGRRATIRLIPEFIPPQAVPPLVQGDLVRLRRSHRFLVGSGGSSLAFHDGAELYGLDLVVEAVALAWRRGLDVALGMLLPGVRDEGHLARIEQRCRALGIADRVQVVTAPLPEAASFWREADVTVRATNTDGNSLAVLEALWLGVPVVASDCVERPAGSVLFRTRDASDLAHKLESVLADLPTARARARAVTHSGSVQAFLDLYDALAAGVGSHAAA